MKKLLFVLAMLLVAPRAWADIPLDDLAPRAVKCWGSTCLMPAVNVSAAMFDLKLRKWEAGAAALGAGGQLIFGTDQLYGSGIVVNFTGVYKTKGASWVMPTVGLVLFRYLQVGYSYRYTQGFDRGSYISIAGIMPWDLLTGDSLRARVLKEVLDRMQGGAK